MILEACINRIIATRRAIMVFFALATLASVIALATIGLKQDYRLEAFVAGSDASYERFRAFMSEFSSNEFAVLAIHGDEPYGEALEEALTRAALLLRAVPTVDRASAITDIPAYLRAAAGDRLLSHPLFAGNLISLDKRTVAVLCRMSGEDADGAARRAAVKQLRAVTDELRSEFPSFQFILTGPYVTLIDMYAYVDRDLVVFSVLAFALIVVTLGAVFRSWRPMLYAGGVAAAAILCTLGLTIALGIVCSLITQMLVILIIVLAVANGVHLAVAAEESCAGVAVPTGMRAYRQTLRRMLAPCTAVMITTAAGFGSVCVSEIAPVRRFGALMVFGLLFALVLAVAAVGPLHGRGRSDAAHGARLARGLAGCARLALRGRALWAIAFIVGVTFAAYGIGRLRFESDFVKNFRPDSEVRRSYRFIEKNLSPLGAVEIVARRKDGARAATARGTRIAHELGEDVVAQYAPVKRAMTLYDLLTLAIPLPPASDADVAMRLDLTRKLPAGEDLVRGFLNADGDAQRINLRCVEGFAVEEKLRVCDQIEAEAQRRFGPEYDVEVTGLYHFYAGLVAGLLNDQYRALGLTIAMIAVVVAVLLRSLRWTLIAMTVNLLPVVVCLGMMGWWDIPVNMTTAMMLSATLGIAVDDTLHYIWRFRRELESCGDVGAALVAAHRSVGKACVFTTVVITGGFSILILSRFLPTAYFGGLVGFTMLVALTADLFLLPVLIAWFIPDRASSPNGRSTINH
jgi:predicted RND superfamily exporter protein